jgi:hypothetical protein
MLDQDPYSDPKTWIAALALLVSCCAAFISGWSLRNSSRALALSEGQEKRRQPQLKVYLVNGYRRLVPARQLFGFLVSVSNPTDINNSVPRAELQVTYLVGDVRAVCRVQHNPELADSAVQSGKPPTVFTLPARIDAHQTTTGWLLFALDNDLIQKGTIDAHSLLLEDTHGVITSTGPIMVKEWSDETQKD